MVKLYEGNRKGTWHGSSLFLRSSSVAFQSDALQYEDFIVKHNQILKERLWGHGILWMKETSPPSHCARGEIVAYVWNVK